MEIKLHKSDTGEWELDVLANPFGGPINGKDYQGEYFSPDTNYHEDKIPLPPVVYYHGRDDSGKPASKPEFIGKTIKRWTDDRGVWYRVVLDKANGFAKRVWEAAKEGLARASSGAVMAAYAVAPDGKIKHWLNGEVSLFEIGTGKMPANMYAVALPAMKALYDQAGIAMPDMPEPEAEDRGESGSDAVKATIDKPVIKEKETEMSDEKEVKGLTAEDVVQLLESRDAQKAAKAEAEKARLEEIEKIKAEAKAEAEKEWAQANRLGEKFGGKAPAVIDGDIRQFDGLDAGDQAVLVGVLQSARDGKHEGASQAAFKSLAMKLNDDKTRVGEMGRQAMKAVGMKPDEVDYSTLASYGDEWVGVAYSQAIWDSVRAATFVAQKLPSVEVPNGVESIYLPLESTDPVWYKVAENTTYDATMKTPVATVSSSRLGTGRVQMTLSKMGARTLWTGEMQERSLIPFVNQLRAQLVASGAEQLEGVIIDGDTATSSNINDIGGTTYSGAATSLFLMFNGFRKSPLVTTTANSRSAGGALEADDYLKTIQLMGTAGINALDQSKVSFIIDPNTHWASLRMPEVKTQDVFSRATLENGRLRSIYGYDVDISANMHRASAARLANSSGKVDQDTTTNNAYGAILAVRWDQWRLGYQRRMTMETTRFANSDTNEIVAMMSLGLIQRDTEASAISYYVGV